MRIGSRRWPRLLLGLLVVGLAADLSGRPASAGPPPSGRQNLKARQEALGEVRRQLDEARERALAAQRREMSLLAELEGIDRSLGQKRTLAICNVATSSMVRQTVRAAANFPVR